MLKNFKELRKGLNTFEGKINFVTYMTALVLLALSFIYMIFYIYEGVYIMIIIDIINIIILNHYVYNGIKKQDLYSIVAYAIITVHAVSAILSVGWDSGFYLWLFAIECIFFLPSFGDEDDRTLTRPLYLGLIFAFIYFGLGFLVPSGLVKPLYQISRMSCIRLFGLNSLVVFMAIISFTYFFTTRQKVRETNLKKLAENDNLTGLKNRNAINKVIDERAKESKAYSLAILDIDLFKNVNDTYGHNAGDVVLKELSNMIRELEGFGIVAARWGGEEFIILGPSDMNQKQFIDIMQAFRRKVRESIFKYERSIIKITVSIGVARFNKNDKIKDVIEKADKHLYHAKETGRNRVVFK